MGAIAASVLPLPDPRQALREAIERRNHAVTELRAAERLIEDRRLAVIKAREELRKIQEAPADPAVTTRAARERVTAAEQLLQGAEDDVTDANRSRAGLPSVDMHSKMWVPAAVANVVRSHPATAAMIRDLNTAQSVVARLRPVAQYLDGMLPRGARYSDVNENLVEVGRWRNWVSRLHEDADAELI